MATRGDIQVNNFVKGLITEASPLTFPQGASLDELNFKLKRDGTRERRLGIDLEDGYGLYDLGISADVLSQSRITAYRWSIPNGDITSDIGVIQVGNSIYFINLYAAAPSAAVINGGVPIVSPDIGSQQIMTFTSLNNYLIGVSNALDNPYLFTYDRTTQTVTAETSSIMVRDLWGVQDEVDVNQRPSILTPEHHYNLLNQGWDNNIKTTCGDGVNAVDCTFNTFGVYPANGDQWSQGRIEDLTSADVMKYDPEIAGRMWINTGQVAKGHFIIPIYNRGSYRTNATGLTLPTDRETGRITTVASYAGRVFYGGILSRVIGADNRSPSYNGTIFFSQIFTDKINLVKCYQEADPTNPDLNDIVDTDGGIIQIPECSYIYLLKSIKQSLFVFAANGVWEIRGDEGGFRATSFQVNKISNIGVYAPKSVVEVNGTILFWGNTGIYAISPNQFGTWDTQDLTQNTIQRLYNAIPDASKRNVRGMYDNKNNRARWMYYSPDNKVLGQPVENIETPITPYFEIGSTTSVGFTVPMAVVDCISINPNKYCILALRSTVGSKHLYASIVDVSGVDITINTPILLDNTVNSYIALSVCMLDTTKMLVTLIDETSGRLYGILCEVSGSSINKLSITNLIAAYPTSSVKVSQIDSNRSLVLYNATATSNPTAAVISVSGTILSLGTPVTVSTTTSFRFDLSQSIDKTNFYYFGVNNIVLLTSIPLSVTGTTVIVGSSYGNVGAYSNSITNNIINVDNTNLLIKAQKFGGGTTIGYVSTGALTTSIDTIDTNTHTSSDIFKSTRNRLYLVYCAATGLSANDFIEILEYTYSSSSFTLSDTVRIQSSVSCKNSNFSKKVLTSTKVPLVYIEDTSAPGTVKTLVLETGN